MKKTLLIAVALAFVATFSFGSVAIADDLVPGAYAQQDQSVMGVTQTMMQMGARARALTRAVDLASGAGQSRSSVSVVNTDFQFGQSQTDQSWKAARTVEEAEVHGLVAGDCQGENSDDAYNKQMNISRKGYSPEKLVSNADCGAYHPTVKIGLVK